MTAYFDVSAQIPAVQDRWPWLYCTTVALSVTPVPPAGSFSSPAQCGHLVSIPVREGGLPVVQEEQFIARTRGRRELNDRDPPALPAGTPPLDDETHFAGIGTAIDVPSFLNWSDLP
jgi:hypothetical protein